MTSLLLLASCATLSPELRGQRDAERDAARGEFSQLTGGLRGSDAPSRDQRLFEKYGVHMRVSSGCVVSPEEVAYRESYNAAAKARIDQHFGPGYLDRAIQETYYH
jgi:hypothetical protein